MKIRNCVLLLIICGLLVLACKKDDTGTSEPPEKIYYNDLINPSIQELELFFEDGYNVIDGKVELNNVDSLFNMLTFSNLRKITGSFAIENNYDLVSLDGLNNLKTIGGSLIIFNTSLAFTNFEGLNKLDSVGALVISANIGLISFEGLSNLKYVGSGIMIERNDNLISLQGMSELKSISNLIILNNSSIQSLDYLDSIDIITNKLTIGENIELSNFCSLRSILPTGIGGAIMIYDNKYNPSKDDIITGNCSL